MMYTGQWLETLIGTLIFRNIFLKCVGYYLKLTQFSTAVSGVLSLPYKKETCDTVINSKITILFFSNFGHRFWIYPRQEKWIDPRVKSLLQSI